MSQEWIIPISADNNTDNFISLNIPFYIHEVKDVAVGDSIYLFNKQHEIPFSKCNVIGVDIDASSVKDSLILDGLLVIQRLL